MTGPRMPATLKLMGRMRKARDWKRFSRVISAIMVRLRGASAAAAAQTSGHGTHMMPTVPLMAPPSARQKAAQKKDVAKP